MMLLLPRNLVLRHHWLPKILKWPHQTGDQFRGTLLAQLLQNLPLLHRWPLPILGKTPIFICGHPSNLLQRHLLKVLRLPQANHSFKLYQTFRTPNFPPHSFLSTWMIILARCSISSPINFRFQSPLWFNFSVGQRKSGVPNSSSALSRNFSFFAKSSSVTKCMSPPFPMTTPAFMRHFTSCPTPMIFGLPVNFGTLSKAPPLPLPLPPLHRHTTLGQP